MEGGFASVRESMSLVGIFAESLLGWVGKEKKKTVAVSSHEGISKKDKLSCFSACSEGKYQEMEPHQTQKCLQSTRKESPASSSPFEAISQTEFLSFDQLSQSSHIYLAGEAGDTL